MKSCSGLARLLTQIRAMMPAHSLVTNTDCPSRSQAPLAALWKDLVVGRALSRKWGPLRFGTEMTGVTESCKAKSASISWVTDFKLMRTPQFPVWTWPTSAASPAHPPASHWLPRGAPSQLQFCYEKKGAISHGREEARALWSPPPPHAAQPGPGAQHPPKGMPVSFIPTREFLTYRMVFF